MNLKLLPGTLRLIGTLIGILLAVITATATATWNLRGSVLEPSYATWKQSAEEYDKRKQEFDQGKRDVEVLRGDSQKLRDEIQKLQDSFKDRDKQGEIALLKKKITQLEKDLASPPAERELSEGKSWQLVPNRWVLGVETITQKIVTVNLGNINQNTDRKDLGIGHIVTFDHAGQECVVTLLDIDTGLFVKKSARLGFTCH